MNRALQIYREYPRDFWMMIFVNFIDRLGGRCYSRFSPCTSQGSLMSA